MVDKNLKRGDIVLISFDPSLGHEQKGFRPAIVVSHDLYNKNANVVVFCPITSKTKNFPFEVILETIQKNISGFVLTNHIKSFDKKEIKIKKIGRATDDCIEMIKAKLATLIVNN